MSCAKLHLSKFRAALIFLKGLYDPTLSNVLNLENIKSSLEIQDNSLLCVSCFHSISSPAKSDNKRLLNQSHIKQLITTTNGILETQPELFNTLVQQQYGITEPQVELNGLQINIPKEYKGLLRKTSALLIRNGYMISAEIPSVIVAGVLSIFANSNWDPKTFITDPNKLPVLFVHGLKHNQSGWSIGHKLLEKSEYKESFGSFYYISYDKTLSNSWDKTIDDFVAIISIKIAEILGQTGHKNIILVGHSLGGIICSRYAETHRCVEHVITIGTPFDGSHIANLLKNQKDYFGLSHREIDKQLTIGSPILIEIAENARKADWSGKTKYYCIRSNADALVPKHNTFVTKDPRRQFTLASIGHVAMLFTPNVWSKIAEWLHQIHTSA